MPAGTAGSASPRSEFGSRRLFDGTEETFRRWEKVGDGAFRLVDGCIVAQPGDGPGLLYYAADPFSDFVLHLDFRIEDAGDNSGIFVRSRDPAAPVPGYLRRGTSHRYTNRHWVAVDTGFEVQIDETAQPDGLDEHRTGAIYEIDVGPHVGQQRYRRPAPLRTGQWNTCRIEVSGNNYRVSMNGARTTVFTNLDAFRGAPARINAASGFLGLQAHTGHVAFRDVRIEPV